MSRTKRSPLKDLRWAWHDKPEARRQYQRGYRKRANQKVAVGLEPPKWQKTAGYLTW